MRGRLRWRQCPRTHPYLPLLHLPAGGRGTERGKWPIRGARGSGAIISGEHVPADRVPESYIFPNPSHFGFNARIFIGAQGDGLRDSFNLLVCSPSWFAE